MCLHAEENALLYVSQKDLEDSTLYVSLHPCISCVKKIIQCGIRRVVYLENYSIDIDDVGDNILRNSDIEIYKYEGDLKAFCSKK